MCGCGPPPWGPGGPCTAPRCSTGGQSCTHLPATCGTTFHGARRTPMSTTRCPHARAASLGQVLAGRRSSVCKRLLTASSLSYPATMHCVEVTIETATRLGTCALLSKRCLPQLGAADRFVKAMPTSFVNRDAIATNDGHPWAQYNTCYWKLVHSGRTRQQAQNDLKVPPSPQRTRTCVVHRDDIATPLRRSFA